MDAFSEEGKKLLTERYKRFKFENYINSIAKYHKIEILLQPPKSPYLELHNAIIHFRGNLKSNVTLIEVSDFECEKCREYHPVIDSLYKKYKSKVRFGFTHYSNYVSLSAIFSECASKQNKFWIAYDSIFRSNKLLEKVEFYRLAKNIHLNLGQFDKDFQNKNIHDSIKSNIELITKAGIYGTPTIIVNGKLILDSSSKKEIEKLIESELKK